MVWLFFFGGWDKKEWMSLGGIQSSLKFVHEELSHSTHPQLTSNLPYFP